MTSSPGDEHLLHGAGDCVIKFGQTSNLLTNARRYAHEAARLFIVGIARTYVLLLISAIKKGNKEINKLIKWK